MAASIFLNYRRSENLKDAQHLATLLGRRFGEKRIFIDERGIDGGEHWPHTLKRQVTASHVMVSLIGKGWADVKDDQGNRRLDSPNDFVRFEIAQAFQWGIPVLPVVLDGAQMPKAAALPEDISELTRFQAMPLRTESFVQDAEAIARRLKTILDKRQSRGVPVWTAAVGAAILLAVGIAAGPFALNRLGLPYLGAPASGDPQAAASLADLRVRFAAAQDTAGKAEERVALATRQLRAAEQDRDALRTSLADLQKSHDSASGESARTREEIERIRAAAVTAQQARDQALKDLAIAVAKIGDLQKALAAVKPELEETRKRVAEQAQRDQQELERLRSALATALKEKDQLLSGLANAPIVSSPSNNSMSPEFRPQLVPYKNSYSIGTIVVHANEYKLYYIRDGELAIRYGFGIGRTCPNWTGIKTVSKKEEWPDWQRTAEWQSVTPGMPSFMAGGVGNPLGARAIYLGSAVDLIHGTNRPSSIGRSIATGCIQLINEDIQDLYFRVSIGAQVIKIP